MAPASVACVVLVPDVARALQVKKSIGGECRGYRQILGPIARRSGEPSLEWCAKTHPRTINQFYGYMTTEHLAERPFCWAIAKVNVEQPLPNKVNQFTVKKWRGPVCFEDFGQNALPKLTEDPISEAYKFRNLHDYLAVHGRPALLRENDYLAVRLVRGACSQGYGRRWKLMRLIAQRDTRLEVM